jgi:hypothetical protein
MCIKKVNGKWKLDSKNTFITVILTAASIVTAYSVITAQCNKAVEAAQCELVKPIAQEVFDSSIAPYKEEQRKQGEDMKILIEMLKIGLPNGEDICKQAQRKIETTGKFEGRD